jgi:ribonuclease G
MPSKMLIDADAHQARIAVLEDDRLAEIFVERTRHRGLVGNVYKGRVTRVLPGMQAAFVDIGLARDAFLYVSDAGANLDTLDEIEPAHETDGDGEEAGESADGRSPEASTPPSIDSLLKPGQEILVQVTKDPFANKGARVSTQITLPGRYLVLLPGSRHLGVSRRIEDEGERARLRGVLEEMTAAGGAGPGGFIVRTAGEGRGRDEFEADRRYLGQLWERLRQSAERASAPALIHRDLDLALRVVRDLFGPSFTVLWVDGEEVYERIVDFLDQVQPALVRKVRLYGQTGALFERFRIDAEIETALSPKVWLKSGGYIVINPTEALVAIDVNTGRFVGQHNLEDTVLRTNLEAVREIVRQIRLRDLGGIVVVDLIDMAEASNRQTVMAALEGELKKDRSRNQVLSISDFGLVELTRKRSRQNLERLYTQPCPHCDGEGKIRSIVSICLDLRREMLRQRDRVGGREVLVRLHPEVAAALQGPERAILDELERAVGVPIVLRGDPDLHHERFDILDV